MSKTELRDGLFKKWRARERIGRCAGSIRHWFTMYDEVGSRRSNCTHCGQPFPGIAAAVERGLYYARLYTPPDDSPAYVADEQRRARDIELMEDALKRLKNEYRAAHKRLRSV